jgi:N-acetyl-anhydromuramyl-L-alanine amidase AmpD
MAAQALAALGAFVLAGCATVSRAPTGVPAAGREDEIVVAGQRFHTGTRIVTWLESSGYDAYQGPPAFGPRPGRPDLATLRRSIDQFVLHYDASGLSKVCFNVLRQRRLSVHFLLDVDGTIYQTMDLKERAAHATVANDRSIGIEIANLGAYRPGDTQKLEEWYRRDATGDVRLVVPARIRDPGIRTRNFTGRPARPAPVRGRIQDAELVQYDFTPEQYAALARLTTALCRVFPRLKCDYPHDAAGRLRTGKLSDAELAKYRGLLGHYHIQADKIDPGPALQWRRIIEDARKAQ